MTGEDLIALGQAVSKGTKDNPAFSDASADIARLNATLEKYPIAIGDAVDGGKKAIAERERQREELIDVLRALSFHVETACKDDITKFLSSGFTPRSTTRTAPQAVYPPSLRVDYGPGGTLKVKLSQVDPKAWSHEVESAPIGPDGVPGKWNSRPVTSVARLIPITGLTPGTTYAFHARSLGHLGFGAWSDIVTKMST
jgi:hypothetical protein